MNSKGMSIAGLVLGIVSVCGFWFTWTWVVLLFFAAGIVGIILAAKGSAAAKANNEPKGLAIAGLVCSIIGTALCGIAVICWIACAACVASVANDLGASYSDLNDIYNSLY